MTGAERVWQELRTLGVTTVFGVPGGAILPLVDAMTAYPDLPFIVTRHESAAIHAADGYARVSGKPGIALVTSGPGGTNAMTGMMTAMTDSVPLVVLVGQVPTALIGSDAFQEADLFTMSLSIVKHSWKVEHADEVGSVVREAYALAQSGRPGPVMVELPKDVQLSEVSVDVPHAVEFARSAGHVPRALTWARAKSYLKRAERPLFYIGGGIVASDTSSYITQWAKRYHAPVTTTLLGIGAFPGSHPLNLGMLGMHGTWTANHAMQDADLIVALGVRFDDRVTGRVETFAPRAKIIHVEIDPAEHRKIVVPDITIRGDLREILPHLDQIIPEAEHRDWIVKLSRLKEQHPLHVKSSESGQLASGTVLTMLSEHLMDNDVVVTDVGQHQMWAALWLKRERPRRFVTSGGAGTMGYGLPAAVGAEAAIRGQGRVFLIAGDGSFQMNLQELATVAQFNIPIIIMVMNNGGHGMVRQWQDLFHGARRHGVALSNPDFVDLARVFGIPGMSVKTESEFRGAMQYLVQASGPVIFEVHIDNNEMVFPMVPSGHSLDDVIEG